ncbi:16S rRNA (guanine(966)-N(2))-methyltransferase RsmD [Patescibacteria group bacterium]
MSNPRIITGSAKGQRLEVPKRGTRPMTARVKSALFSMISQIIPDSRVLDLYAGSGALGIECLSRGAKSAVFIDKSKHAVECIQKNLQNTGFEALGRIVKCSVSRFLDEYDTFKLEPPTFNIIFFAPPYRNFKEKVLAKTINIIDKNGIVVAEHSNTRKINDRVGLSCRNEMKTEQLEKIDERRYGITKLSFFSKTK